MIVGRDARHRDRAFGEFRDIVAADVVGRDRGLTSSDQHTQTDVVTLGAFRFLDASVANLDALRDATHRDRVRGIRARALRSLDQPFSELTERGLIEEFGFCGFR